MSNLKKLVDQFAEAVIKRNESIMSGSRKEVIKYSNKVIQYWEKVCQLGDKGKEELSNLFHHENPGVRTTAAACLLKYKNKESLDVLKEIAKGQGLVPFEASEAIKRWEEGTWNLD